MQIDLTAVAGFPLLSDTGTLKLETSGGLRLEIVARSIGQMASVLLEPDALSPEADLYWICRLYDDRPGAVLAQARLAFACVLLPPLTIGREFAKTQGHYHPAMPGGHLAYPEVYTHYYGRLNGCILIDHPAKTLNRGSG